LRMLRRFFLCILCLCLLACCAPDLIPEASAASAMTASEACVEFVKKAEGFSPQPYYDYGQHTVGYGTKCPTDKYFDYMVNGIPKSEADALLRETLEDVADAVSKKLIDQYGLTFTQHQFDALVSFTFNLGTGWMSYDSALRNTLLHNAGSNDLVYAFCLYSTAGGTYSSGLINRRLCEANMYLNGIYSSKPSDSHGYVFYEPNGGSLTYQVQGFVCDSRSAPAADAVRQGDVFQGWYTELTGGTRVSELSGALSGKTLFARWQSSENQEPSDTAATLIRVTGDVVNIRKGPGTNYGIARQVRRNDELLVSLVTNLLNRNWGKVQDGWICLEYTNYEALLHGSDDTDTGSDTQPPAAETVPGNNDAVLPPASQQRLQGTVKVNDLLRIRSGPGTGYSTVGYLFNGNRVEILEQTAGGAMAWGRIDRGWVCMDYIETDRSPQMQPEQEVPPTQPEETEPPAQPEPQPPEQTEPPTQDTSGEPQDSAVQGVVLADALRIRSGAGTGYPIVGFYYEYNTVTVLETLVVDSVKWGRTNRGWIHMDYVQTGGSVEESPPQPEDGRMTVIADCLRVRKDTSTDSRIAALLYYGDQVQVLETKTVDGTAWGRVAQGWICMDYVE